MFIYGLYSYFVKKLFKNKLKINIYGMKGEKIRNDKQKLFLEKNIFNGSLSVHC